MLEKEIQKSILDYLKIKKIVCFKHRNVGIKKPNGSYIPLADGELGISDILGCMPNGQFLAIEVKTEKGRISIHQQEFLDRIRESDGLAFVARSLDDVMVQIP